MGLASSQARLLSLTARKSDLEYRAQNISQRKISLAMQTEQLAQVYNDALSNKIMKFQFSDIDNPEVQKVTLSFDNLTSSDSMSAGNFLVKTASGKVVCLDNENKSSLAVKMAKVDNHKNENESDEEYQKRIMNIVSNDERYSDDKFEAMPALSNAEYFQDCLKQGSLFIWKMDDKGTEFKSTDLHNISSIYDEYDTSDDDAANSEYTAKTTFFSNQDKKLDLELNQIETQHKAIETELESVKKVVKDNIEDTYKIFA